jgi:cysteinyl-tRNA synthetase
LTAARAFGHGAAHEQSRPQWFLRHLPRDYLRLTGRGQGRSFLDKSETNVPARGAIGTFMELKLYNTLTRTKEVFRPLDPARVRMYVCGPTVYDFAHIGNARPVIVFDVLYRLLRHLYPGEGRVKYVRNITDVDDKINARAAEEYPGLPLNEAIRKVTEKTERQFHEDVAALGCLKPDVEPRATEYVRRTDGVLDMVTLIQRLIDNGNAYEKDGHVLFRVGSMPDYGQLANRSLDEMIAGARVEVAPFKENPMDFVLWKPSAENEPGWESPWGRGRPGWHIECSTMSAALLGKEFDIHGGGIDLVFPHHENELAQTRCAFHSDRMAQVWMHNGFLQVEGAKMSKSLGNFVTINELLTSRKFGGQKWHGRVLRLAMLMTHYRQPIDWTADRLFEARSSIYDWNMLCHEVPGEAEPPNAILECLLDDLNAPAAVAALHGLAKDVQRTLPGADKVRAALTLRVGLESLGLFEPRPTVELLAQDVRNRVVDDQVKPLIDARNAARKAKNFKEADRIRDELAAMGVVLKDGPEGTTWEVAR